MAQDYSQSLKNSILETLFKLNEKLLNKIKIDKAFLSKGNKDIQVGVWIFKYNSSTQTISHWDIYPRQKDEELANNIEETIIYKGTGSISKIFHKDHVVTEFVPIPNTFDDPSGTVVKQDFYLGQYSALLVPLKDQNDVKLIFDFFVNQPNFFNDDDDVNIKIKNILLDKDFKESYFYNLEYWNSLEFRELLTSDGNTKKNIDTKNIVNNKNRSDEPFYEFKKRINKLNYRGIANIPYFELRDNETPLTKYINNDKFEQIIKDKLINCAKFDCRSVNCPIFEKNKNSDAKCDLLLYHIFKSVSKEKKKIEVKYESYKFDLIYFADNNIEKQISDIRLDSVVKRWKEFNSKNREKINEIKNEDEFKKKYIAEELVNAFENLTEYDKSNNDKIDILLLFEYKEIPLVKLAKNRDDCFKDVSTSDKAKFEGKFLRYIYLSDSFITSILGTVVANDALFKLLKDDLKLNQDKKFLKENIISSGSLNLHLFLPKNVELEKEVKNHLSHLLSYESINHEKELSIQASIKSGIAAIMSRNGSHNLGSHVLAAVQANINELPDDQILFKYIQHRMDFIAQITTEIPTWSYPVYFLQDMMLQFYKQKHLLNYITESEGLSAFNYQKREYINDEKGKTKLESIEDDSVQLNRIIIIVLDENKKELYNNKEKKDTVLAIPGGVVGQHALFTIFENIIRNSAKHGIRNKKIGQNLEIRIQFRNDLANNTVIFTIWDNLSKIEIKGENDLKLLPENLNDYLNISDKLKKINVSSNIEKLPLHQQQNIKIANSFIDLKTGQIKHESWGLAEMKISVGYLNMKSLKEIGGEGKKIVFNNENNNYEGLIRAIAKEVKKKEYYLGYQFSIPMPMELLIIDKNSNFTQEQIEKAKEFSVDVKKTLPPKLNYEMILFLEEEENVEDYVIGGILPLKVLWITEKKISSNRIKKITKNEWETLKNIIKKDKGWEDLKIELYYKWIVYFYLNDIEKKLNILIDPHGDDKSGGISNEEIRKLTALIYLPIKIKNALSHKVKEEIEKLPKGFSWVAIISKFISNDDSLINRLKKEMKIYEEMVKNLLVKYEEDIETLPRVYKSKTETKTQVQEISINCFKIIQASEKLLEEYLKDNIGLDFNEKHIVYKRHGLDTPQNIGKYKGFSEAVSGAQSYFHLLLNNLENDSYVSQKLVLQLVENGLMRGIIVDERAFKFYSNCDEDIKKRFDISGIRFFQNVEMKKNKVVSKKQNQNDSILNASGLGKNEYHFIIIHQGIVDKIKENKEEIINQIKNNVKIYIITSGRGKPSDLESHTKFIPFSNIENYIMKTYPEKFVLSTLINTVVTKYE